MTKPKNPDILDEDDEEKVQNVKFNQEVRRISKILENGIKKIEFAMVVPELIKNNCELIFPFLTPSEFGFLKNVFISDLQRKISDLSVDYRHTDFFRVQSLSNIELFFNTYESQSMQILQCDANFFKGLNLLYNNSQIRNFSEDCKQQISEAAFNFIQDITFFFYTMINKMKMSPEAEEARELSLSKMFHNHQKMSDEAHILEDEEKENLEYNIKRLRMMEDEVSEERNKINHLIEYSAKVIKKYGAEVEEKMEFDWKASEYEQELLREKIILEEAEFEKLQNSYMTEERELRVRKYKTEQQLAAILKEYDKDMKDRQDLWEAQLEFLENERKQLIELEERYIEQDKEYEFLMQEKNNYEQRLMDAKLYEIKCSIAARKIQKWFRYYKEFMRTHNIVKKKKGKDKKKKKK